MIGRRTVTAMAAVTLTTLNGAAVTATVEAQAGAARPDRPTCWGRPATIVGSGYIRGTSGDNVIVVRGFGEVHAGAGDDRICGAFLVYGGSGDDRIRYGGVDLPEFRGGSGDDHLVSTKARLGDLYGNGGDDLLRVTAGGEQWIDGGPGDDVLIGGSGRDHLFGKRGSDFLRGMAARDVGTGGPDVDECRSIEDKSGCESPLTSGRTSHQEPVTALHTLPTLRNSRPSLANGALEIRALEIRAL